MVNTKAYSFNSNMDKSQRVYQSYGTYSQHWFPEGLLTHQTTIHVPCKQLGVEEK